MTPLMVYLPRTPKTTAATPLLGPMVTTSFWVLVSRTLGLPRMQSDCKIKACKLGRNVILYIACANRSSGFGPT